MLMGYHGAEPGVVANASTCSGKHALAPRLEAFQREYRAPSMRNAKTGARLQYEPQKWVDSYRISLKVDERVPSSAIRYCNN